MTGNVANAIHAARKHRLHQLTAWEAIHPSLHRFFSAFDGFRLILRRSRQQISLGESVIAVIQRIGAIQHGFELTADAVIIHRRGKRQHVGVVHLGGDFHRIIPDDAVPQLHASHTALAKSILLFPQMHNFHLMTRLQRAFGEGGRQRFRVAALAGAGRKNQHLFGHRKILLESDVLR